MGTATVSCSLSNLGKFKCYTQSGSKKVYEDDGLRKAQSFIIFPNKTTLSTGECEYTIGVTGYLNAQHPWIDWTYTVPSNATPGTTYSYTMTGGPMPLSNYKGAIVNGIPTKKWTWDIKNIEIINIQVSISANGYNNGGHVAFSCSVSGDKNGITNNTLANDILRSNSISLSWKAVTPAGPLGSYTTSIRSTGSLTLNTGVNYVTGTQYYIDTGNPPYCSPSSGTYNGHNWNTNVTTRT